MGQDLHGNSFGELEKDSSPYGVDVSKGILQAKEQCDKNLLDEYLKDI